MAAARDVDDVSAFRELPEHLGIQNAPCVIGKWKQAYQKIAAREKGRQFAFASKAFDACHAFARATPAGDLKIEIAQAFRGQRANFAEPQNSDKRVFRAAHGQGLSPFAFGLRAVEETLLAMMHQNMQH